MTEAGFPVHRDAIWRHLKHAAPATDRDDSADPLGLIVASAVADVLIPWPTTAADLVDRLIADGADQAASLIANRCVYPAMRSDALVGWLASRDDAPRVEQ